MLVKLTTQGLDGTPCDLVYRSGETILLPDLDHLPEDLHVTNLEDDFVRQAMQRPIAVGFHSYLGLALAAKKEILGTVCLFDQGNKVVMPTTLSLLGTIAQQVGILAENASLFQRTQESLAETEALYSIIREMNAAQSYDDILRALAERTVLRTAETLFMGIFDQPMSVNQRAEGSPGAGQMPEWIYPVAVRGGQVFEIAPRYPVSAFQSSSNTLFTDTPVVLQNLSSDKRLDAVTRTLFRDVFLAESAIIIPFVLGDQSIGFAQAFFCQPVEISKTEAQRLTAIAGQAAIAVQSRLLLEQAQSRARQEQRIRQVTAEVFSASDVDTIMRRAAEQVGRVLGMPAYVYLSQADQPDRGDVHG